MRRKRTVSYEDMPLEPGEYTPLKDKKLSDDINKKIENILPNSYDDFEKIIEGKENTNTDDEDKKPDKFLGKKLDKLQVRRRAYELIVKGYSSNSYLPMLEMEFGIGRKAACVYVADLREEVKTQYEEVHVILREAILLDLIQMKNNSKSIMEQLKCVELMVKITGLSQETLNVKQTTEQQILMITQTTKKKEDENNE